LAVISALLMLSRKPAKLAGVQSLYMSLLKKRGFKAFKKLGYVDEFILPIVHMNKFNEQDVATSNQANPLPDV